MVPMRVERRPEVVWYAFTCGFTFGRIDVVKIGCSCYLAARFEITVLLVLPQFTRTLLNDLNLT